MHATVGCDQPVACSGYSWLCQPERRAHINIQRHVGWLFCFFLSTIILIFCHYINPSISLCIKSIDTLKSSYDQLSRAAEKLLIENWHDYVCGLIKPTKQIGEGSTHQIKDKIPWLHLLENDGWNTPVTKIQGAALRKF